MKLHFYISCFLVFLCASLLNQCKKNQDLSYIEYYQEVNKIDSLYRITNDPKDIIKSYKKLFQKFPPKNQNHIQELETYIRLSDQQQVDFGGKTILYRLIEQNTPFIDENLFPLFRKYGIDSTEVRKRIMEMKNNIDKKLLDSLTLASKRDHEGNRTDPIIMKRNDSKNLNLFLWIFDNYGFPSEQKVGTSGNDGEPLAIITILSHLICLDYDKIYPKLNEYLKKGEISPQMYAIIIDKYYLCKNNKTYYNLWESVSSEDSLEINRRRKAIGLPSLMHYSNIKKSFNNRK
ncbi:hypothetical protein [Chryseobacterium oryctis]|uniref:Lipoprotein n=1 Tax=Chryseobacterium oryctis TaxID=2952618 RepID=A0ABT3HJG6_9FLAO|nr:hypothetical protein [Chryseobacterium oryctis]MCW3159930.1 hypothetical protein [Chryseobacterium oryctis]